MKKIFTLATMCLAFMGATAQTLTLAQTDGTAIENNSTITFTHVNAGLAAYDILQIEGHLTLTASAACSANVIMTALEGEPIIDFCVDDACRAPGAVVNIPVTMEAGKKYAIDFHLGGGEEYTLASKLTSKSRLEVKLGDNVVLTNTVVLTNEASGINDVVAADAPAVYYNLQGQRVANPVAGQLLIKRQGDNVTKTVIK